MEEHNFYFLFDGFDIIISKTDINIKEFTINKKEDNSMISDFILIIYYNKNNKF